MAFAATGIGIIFCYSEHRTCVHVLFADGQYSHALGYRLGHMKCSAEDNGQRTSFVF